MEHCQWFCMRYLYSIVNACASEWMRNGKLKLKLVPPEKKQRSMTRRCARMPTLLYCMCVVVAFFWCWHQHDIPKVGLTSRYSASESSKHKYCTLPQSNSYILYAVGFKHHPLYSYPTIVIKHPLYWKLSYPTLFRNFPNIPCLSPITFGLTSFYIFNIYFQCCFRSTLRWLKKLSLHVLPSWIMKFIIQAVFERAPSNIWCHGLKVRATPLIQRSIGTRVLFSMFKIQFEVFSTPFTIFSRFQSIGNFPKFNICFNV